jgi:hypothetical protein
MIRELFEYWITPASLEARKSGYLYESIAYESRAQRQRQLWKLHWEACHQQVESFLKNHSRARSLTLLGSGSLYEVPLPTLTAKMDRVLLVDRVFPRSVLSWARKQSIQIEMKEWDLSRGLPPDCESDLVISANLLSQLVLPFPEERQAVEQIHLQSLKNLKAPCLLWTDTQRLFFQKSTDQLIQEEPTVLTPLSNIQAEWIWHLAPAPEIHPELDIRLKVQAAIL